MEVISKEEAISKGLKKYFTGEPCKKGHIAPISISQNRCWQCHLDSTNKWRRMDREQRPDHYKEYERSRDPDKVKAKNKKWHESNREKVLARLSKFEKDNKDRRNEYKRTKYKTERVVWSNNRRARKYSATPFWSDLGKIKNIYGECERISKETGIPHHVDHIVPLKHPLVCGLHVPANLRIITAEENLAKNNKFEIE